MNCKDLIWFQNVEFDLLTCAIFRISSLQDWIAIGVVETAFGFRFRLRTKEEKSKTNWGFCFPATLRIQNVLHKSERWRSETQKICCAWPRRLFTGIAQICAEH